MLLFVLKLVLVLNDAAEVRRNVGEYSKAMGESVEVVVDVDGVLVGPVGGRLGDAVIAEIGALNASDALFRATSTMVAKTESSTYLHMHV